MSALSARLARIYQDAPQETRDAGSDWYTNARAEAAKMARDHGTTVAVAAGVIAALSPRIHWVRNLAVARLAVAGLPVSGVFRANLAKANRIVAGERPLDVLSGPKTRAFYRAIAGDDSAAVVDIWMLRAARFRGDKPSERDYNRIALAIATAANDVGTTVTSLQAVVWTAVRGRHD